MAKEGRWWQSSGAIAVGTLLLVAAIAAPVGLALLAPSPETSDDSDFEDYVNDVIIAPDLLLLVRSATPTAANPWLSQGSTIRTAASIVLEPLARINPDGALVPALGEFIPSEGNGISDDRTEISWTLRNGLVWSDGTPLTSDDFVFTYEYCLDEETGCVVDLTAIADVIAPDDRTVTVVFHEPQPFPFTMFVGYRQPVIQRAQFQNCVGVAAQNCLEENSTPIGTGPFRLVRLDPGSHADFEANSNYRGAALGQPALKTILLTGWGVAEDVLKFGSVDYVWGLDRDRAVLEEIAQDAGIGRVAYTTTSSVERISLNQTNNRATGSDRSNFNNGTNPHPLFANNPDLARALSLAIDRDQLAENLDGDPTCNIWNAEDSTSTNNDWCLIQNIDEANAILDDLGYVDTDGDGIRNLPDGTALEVDFTTSTDTRRQANQELIQGYWADIGVAATMMDEEAQLLFETACSTDACLHKFFTDIEMFRRGPASPDPIDKMKIYTTGEIPTRENDWNGENVARISHAELDAAWQELSTMDPDDPARNDLIIRMNDIISADTGAIIPLVERPLAISAIINDIANTGPINPWDSQFWNIQEWTRE